MPLGRERMLDVGEAEVGLGDLVLVEPQFGAVCETDITAPDCGSTFAIVAVVPLRS